MNHPFFLILLLTCLFIRQALEINLECGIIDDDEYKVQDASFCST